MGQVVRAATSNRGFGIEVTLKASERGQLILWVHRLWGVIDC
jgi:hypothetical protein